MTFSTRRAGDPNTAWQLALPTVSRGFHHRRRPSAPRPRAPPSRVHLKPKARSEFLDPEARLRTIVKSYSDHVAIPIELAKDADKKPETLNTASALWTRPKGEITPEDQYREFYHHTGHTFDDPWMTLHNSGPRGCIEYTRMLLFVPSSPPLDLFNPATKTHG